MFTRLAVGDFAENSGIPDRIHSLVQRLCERSIFPFDCGWNGEVLTCVMPEMRMNSFKSCCDELRTLSDIDPRPRCRKHRTSQAGLMLRNSSTKLPAAALNLTSVPMERAGKTLARLKMSKTISAGELACVAWPEAVGATIARYSTAIALVRNKLVVEVEDATWQQPLFQLESQILKRIAEVLGPGLVRDLEIRIARPRRPPQRAAQLAPSSIPSESADDADRIQDSVMRMVYKQSRKKATA